MSNNSSEDAFVQLTEATSVYDLVNYRNGKLKSNIKQPVVRLNENSNVAGTVRYIEVLTALGVNENGNVQACFHSQGDWLKDALDAVGWHGQLDFVDHPGKLAVRSRQSREYAVYFVDLSFQELYPQLLTDLPSWRTRVMSRVSSDLVLACEKLVSFDHDFKVVFHLRGNLSYEAWEKLLDFCEDVRYLGLSPTQFTYKPEFFLLFQKGWSDGKDAMLEQIYAFALDYLNRRIKKLDTYRSLKGNKEILAHYGRVLHSRAPEGSDVFVVSSNMS